MSDNDSWVKYVVVGIIAIVAIVVVLALLGIIDLSQLGKGREGVFVMPGPAPAGQPAPEANWLTGIILAAILIPVIGGLAYWKRDWLRNVFSRRRPLGYGYGGYGYGGYGYGARVEITRIVSGDVIYVMPLPADVSNSIRSTRDTVVFVRHD